LSEPTVTAAVLTRDEEVHLPDCLASLSWADELLVLDSESSDRTREIAGGFTDRIFVQRFENFSRQRNRALALATGGWVFFVDADERASPALAAEVRRTIAATDRAGFWVPRRNIILGRWIRHAGWYPDHQLRLLRRDRARYDETREVHEVAEIDGPLGYLQEHLLHFNYDRVGEFLAKQEGYARYEARSLSHAGVRPRPHAFLLHPWREFRRRYFALAGYRDGPLGLFLCAAMAWFSFRTYWRLSRLTGLRWI